MGEKKKKKETVVLVGSDELYNLPGFSEEERLRSMCCLQKTLCAVVERNHTEELLCHGHPSP